MINYIVSRPVQYFSSPENSPLLFTSDRKVTPEDPTLLQVYEYYIQQEQGLIGITKGKDTVTTYRVRMRKLTGYLNNRNECNIKPGQIDIKFIREYDNWMRKSGITNNYIMKNMQLLNTVLLISLEYGYTERNPMDMYKFRYDRKYDQVTLTMDELRKISEYRFSNSTLQRVCDCFVFSCFTGLCYSDIRQFDKALHIEYTHARPFIMMGRFKTGNDVIVPFFPEAERILEKYGSRLPVSTNQIMNRYIKECMQVIGIGKYITTHTARRTFANLMHNEFCVPIDTVSRMLGHNSIKTTQQYYVSTGLKKVMKDMQGLTLFLRTA